MKKVQWRFLLGGVLVVAGVLALLDTILQISLTGSIWAILFMLAGAAFLFVLASDREAWWAAIPGFTLIGIGLTIGLESWFPRAPDSLSGAFVLGGIAVSFLVIYLLRRNFWWAIIPAGVMASVTLLVLFEGVFREPVWLFFLGLAATFGVLTLVRLEDGKRMTWPIFPAAVMLIMGVIFMIGSVGWANYFWPAALILGGGILIFRALRPRA